MKSQTQLKYNRSVKGICSRAAGYAKYRSNKKGLEYNIDTKYLMSIWPKDNKCPILGYTMRPAQDGSSGQDNYSPSLDRIDPRKGYIKGNCEWVCSLANSMMTAAEGPDLIRFAKWINKRYK